MSDIHVRNNIQIPREAWDTIYLMACAIHQEQPDESRVSAMDLEEIFRISKFHGIESMTFMALENTEFVASADSGLVRKWRETKEKAIRKNMLLDAERQQIFQELDKRKIWHMPLKGIILQQLYPKYGMRQMADNDILYDASRYKEVDALMKRRGFVAEKSAKTYDGAYTREPLYNFEMHIALVVEKGGSGIYYRQVGERLLREAPPSYLRSFTPEDFYIYLMVHTYKHYRKEGIGFRAFADTYLYIWKKQKSLDWDYIKKELGKLGIREFERQFRRLSLKLFQSLKKSQEPDLTEQEHAMLSYCSESGAYGIQKHYVTRRMQEFQLEGGELTFGKKIRYLGKRLFPDMDWFRRNEPFFAKYKIFIPFFLIFRVFRHLILHADWLKTELGILKNVGQEEEPAKGKK